MSHFDDNRPPTVTVQAVDEARPSRFQQVVSGLSLLGALGFTVATIILVLLPTNEREAVVPPTEDVVQAPATHTPTDLPTLPPTAISQPTQAVMYVDALPPTVAPQQLAGLLQTPLALLGDDTRADVAYNPFTIASNDRPRSDFVDYEVVQGDTIGEIAARYGLQQESLAWCNNRDVVLVLRPGDTLRVPPVDGACHRVLGTREETIASIAEEYNIDDPFTIIDSPYNPQLIGRTPSEILPGGTNIFIPGGEGPLIVWNPGYDTDVDEATGQVRGVTFAPGQTGSCGRVSPAGGSVWGNPLPNGTWVRGFYAGHTGIDLAAATGTPIYAANSGYVLFSGFSRWGYGNAVVIEHGTVLSTLYGHMSALYVSCGQFVNTGEIIGVVGSTGNSSGPHLHFEIRSNNTPQNPTLTPGIGW